MLSQKLAAIELNRKEAEPLPTGIAPKVFSPQYRVLHSIKTKPQSKDWTHRLSTESRARQASTLKASASSTKSITPICNLGVARPVASTIPWNAMTMSLKESATNNASSDISMSCLDNETDWDLGHALNYGHSAGSPQLLRFITEHVELVHEPKIHNWATSLTCGNTHALDIILRMLCERGDTLLTEYYTYPGTLEMVKPLGIDLLGVDMDEEGLLPDVLECKLRGWDATNAGRKPFVLYMIPCGQNPTGATQSLERRKAIYEIAERHDLIIIEDDPYFFLRLGEAGIAPPTSADEYLANLPKSYISLDRSGRVLRLDATSKILSAGLRAGWVTGSEQLINQFIYHTEFSTTAVSGPSQIMMYKLLDQTWGHFGFIEWLRNLSARYRESRDALIEACEKWLPACCDWSVPTCGMMVWVRVDLSAFPEDAKRQQDHARIVEDRIHSSAVASGLLLSKGSWFAVPPEKPSFVIPFRLTFAAAPKESFDAGMECLRNAVIDAMSAKQTQMQK